jgi:Uma2 family endonuclease
MLQYPKAKSRGIAMMNPTAPPPTYEAPGQQTPVTFEEYLKQYDGQHAEWHPDGTVEIVVSNNIYHIRMITFLIRLLSFYFEFRRVGQVIPAAFSQRLPGLPAREPDLMLILNENLDRIKETYLDGPADIAIEVVSPESVARDYDDKFKEYAAGGVREYWLIDLERHVFDIHELSPKGRYERRPNDAQGRITSGLLSGFALDPAVLWQDTLPEGEDLLSLVGQLSGLKISVTSDQ